MLQNKVFLYILFVFLYTTHITSMQRTDDNLDQSIQSLLMLAQKHQTLYSYKNVSTQALEIDHFLNNYLFFIYSQNKKQINLSQETINQADLSFFIPLAERSQKQKMEEKEAASPALLSCLSLQELAEVIFGNDINTLPINPLSNIVIPAITTSLPSFSTNLSYQDLFKLHKALHTLVIDYAQLNMIYEQQHKILKSKIVETNHALSELSKNSQAFVYADVQIAVSIFKLLSCSQLQRHMISLEQHFAKLEARKHQASRSISSIIVTQDTIKNYKKLIDGPACLWPHNPRTLNTLQDITIICSRFKI